LPLLGLLNTFEAAFAALALVLLDAAMINVSSAKQCFLDDTSEDLLRQLWCTLSTVGMELTGAQLLGRELDTARHASERSLRDVAAAAGISAGYLQKLERGNVTEPSPKILRRLAQTLGLSYRRLMELAGYELPAKKDRADRLSVRLATASLTEAEERAVSAFIDHLRSQRE
jgi:HTH-type transcriptional regulator, competence development regulator